MSHTGIFPTLLFVHPPLFLVKIKLQMLNHLLTLIVAERLEFEMVEDLQAAI